MNLKIAKIEYNSKTNGVILIKKNRPTIESERDFFQTRINITNTIKVNGEIVPLTLTDLSQKEQGFFENNITVNDIRVRNHNELPIKSESLKTLSSNFLKAYISTDRDEPQKLDNIIVKHFCDLSSKGRRLTESAKSAEMEVGKQLGRKEMVEEEEEELAEVLAEFKELSEEKKTYIINKFGYKRRHKINIPQVNETLRNIFSKGIYIISYVYGTEEQDVAVSSSNADRVLEIKRREHDELEQCHIRQSTGYL